MSLVTIDWLENNLNKVKIIDCSWHMPNVNRNASQEYIQEHIPGAIFFDLDKYSDLKTDLPHMLPNLNNWEKIISSLGISNNDKVIIYDNSDVLSACRCWYNFIYFGHNPNLVSVLDGGFKKWKLEKKTTTNNKTTISKSKYKLLPSSCASFVNNNILFHQPEKPGIGISLHSTSFLILFLLSVKHINLCGTVRCLCTISCKTFTYFI